MNTSKHFITVNGLQVQVVRKRIKNLHLAVYPPDGRIRVAAPEHIGDESIRLAVVQRLPWVKKQRTQLLEQPRQSAREYVTGESHYLKGKRYRMRVVNRPASAKVAVTGNATITLHVAPESTPSERERILMTWYRSELKLLAAPLVEKWQSKLGITISDWRIKRMKTRWGSCNPDAQRIWLNLELIKKPTRCLEYIIVHEMIHIWEPNHGPAFVAHMNRILPDWQNRRDELNRFPAAHESWSY